MAFAFCEVVTLSYIFSLSLSLSLSPSPSLSSLFSLSSFLYLFLALYHAKIFTRVVFLPHMLAFRDTGGIAQTPRYISSLSPSSKTTSCLLDIFIFLALFRFSFPCNFIDLSSL